MKTYQYLTIVLAITLLIAACSPAATPTAQPQPTTVPTASGPNTGLQTRPEANAWANAPQAALAARGDLMLKLSVDPDTIVLVSTDQIDWPDACLGIQLPGKMCAQVLTSGYKIVLGANGQEYEYHTNKTGTNIQLVTK